jgi:UrcA family protein
MEQEETMKMILVSAAVGAVASLLLGQMAMAQSVDEVTIQAKRGVAAKVVGRTSSGIPVADLSLSYDVSAAGLDLASNAGAAEFAKRVNAAALAACRQIGREYPDATPGDEECARAAASEAMVKVRTLAAAAQSK